MDNEVEMKNGLTARLNDQWHKVQMEASHWWCSPTVDIESSAIEKLIY